MTRNTKLFLKPRFQCAKAIKGTRKFHSFITINDFQIRLRKFCNDEIYEDQDICRKPPL